MFVAKALDAVSEEKGRIISIEIICNMLRAVKETTPDDLVAVMYLLSNKIAPTHEGLELRIENRPIITAIAQAYGANEAYIMKQNEVRGDLGLVAKDCRMSQMLLRQPDRLSVAKVFDTLLLIAKECGKISQQKKITFMKALLVAATDCEPQYLIRILEAIYAGKKLRIGSGEQTLLCALGHAAVYSEKRSSPAISAKSLEDAANIVKRVYSECPLYNAIIPALLSNGVWDLHMTCSFSPGIPVGPMLAKPTKKIHYMENGSVEIYSRNAERNTAKFPDVVAAITRLKKPCTRSFVLDSELVAYDHEEHKILSFQILSTRAKKNAVMNEIKVNVCVFAFDILYLNGQLLLREQLNIHREHLYKSFQEEPGILQFITALTTNDLEEIQKFLDDAVNSSCEGLIIKTLKHNATYEPSKRSHNWLKLKKDYIDTIGDSLDLVPIAAFHGRGKRTGIYGTFLLACYDNDKGEFQSMCKIGTGFSEAMLEELSFSLRSKVITKPKSYYRYSDTATPDVWFEPSEVWEVKAANLTHSQVYCAAIGIVFTDRGISLRFPRFVRVREDKTPEQASSSDIADMYRAQVPNLK